MTTRQSGTTQPNRALSQRVSRTSSVATKKAGGIAPASTSSEKSTSRPDRAGSSRSPTVARYGLSPHLDALDGCTVADHPLDADDARLVEA